MSRDNWMLLNGEAKFEDLTGKHAIREAEKQRVAEAKAAAEAKTKADRERGGLWNDHRTQEQKDAQIAQRGKMGDGGASWRNAAIRRAQQTAREHGSDANAVLQERHGSISDLRARNAASSSSSSHRSGRADSGDRRRSWRKDSSTSSSSTSSRWKKRSSEHRDSREPQDPSSQKRFKPNQKDDDGYRAAVPSAMSSSSSTSSSKANTCAAAPTDAIDLEAEQKGLAALLSNQGPSKVKPPPGYVPDNAVPPKSTTTAPQAKPVNVNKLAAKAMKAKMKGNMALYESLQKKIAAARANPAPTVHSSSTLSSTHTANTRERIVVLPTLDSRGRPINVVPVPSSDTTKGNEKASKKRKVNNFSATDQQRDRYLASDVKDEHKDLATLLKEERMGNDRHYDENLARNIVRNSKYKGMSTDEEFDMMDHGYAEQYADRRTQGKTQQVADKRARSSQLNEFRRDEQRLANCHQCFTSQRFQKHLIVSLGLKTYLALPATNRITPGHCVLTTLEHTPSSIEFDEDVMAEITKFRKYLVKMFAAESPSRSCIFFEEVYNVNRKRHTMLHCVPIPMADFKNAPIMFKKAILESDTEWTQNTKLIDTKTKSLKEAIPARFPFFHVEFGVEGGYAHVIEDENKFEENFGTQVVCGLLEEPYQFILRQKRQSIVEESNKVAAFKKAWRKYDWTRTLEGGDMHGK